MSTPVYTDRHEVRRTAARAPVTGGLVFIWLAWALAAAFWALTFTTAIEILGSAGSANGPGPGEADVGGVGWGLTTVVAVVVLGGALAYGAYRYATRDRRADPVSEASTAALYDQIDRDGDDAVSLSPEAHRPAEREALRAAERDLH